MDAIEVVVPAPMDEVEADVRRVLGEQGFGVLTEIDVAGTLRAKLGVDRAPLKILGACNPVLANQALEQDPSVALLLPCNVVLEAAEGGTRVRAIDPMAMLDDPALEPIAGVATQKLQAALQALEGAAKR